MDSIYMGDLSTWKLQDCKDTSRRLLGFDPHNRTLDDLIPAIHNFFHLSTNTKISWHLSGEDCDRPTYGFNRHDYVYSPNYQITWERRPLSLFNETQWPPQHVGRQIVMLHFEPPPVIPPQPRSIRDAVKLGQRKSVGDVACSMLSPPLSSLHLHSTDLAPEQAVEDKDRVLPLPPLSAMRSTLHRKNDEQPKRDEVRIKHESGGSIALSTSIPIRGIPHKVGDANNEEVNASLSKLSGTGRT